MASREVQTLILPILPVVEATDAGAIRHLLADSRVKAPAQRALRGVQSKDPVLGCRDEKHTTHHNRIALHLRSGKSVAGVKSPGDLQLAHIVLVDLIQAR